MIKMHLQVKQSNEHIKTAFMALKTVQYNFV